MHVAMVMTLNSNNPQAYALYCHSRPCSLHDNILGHVPVDYIPSFKSKDFSFTCILYRIAKGISLFP